MAQDAHHVHANAEGNGVQIQREAMAVSGPDIEEPREVRVQAGADTVIARETCRAGYQMALLKDGCAGERSQWAGQAWAGQQALAGHADNNDPADDCLRTPRLNVVGRNDGAHRAYDPE